MGENRPEIPFVSQDKLKRFILPIHQAKKRAEYFKMRGVLPSAEDPCENIKPSLLSADHIIEYVNQTGMISPFTSVHSKDKKSRLKAASYEGRIGDVAYAFSEDSVEPSRIYMRGHKSLRVPANSIIFVECDLEFRLPPFIAVRFNLQINHVHRGLLLGTGPLVDPGFWGKLCIPLHNLTNEDYHIPSDEGLIWIEFTKTTSAPESGKPPSNTEFFDIKKFIDKASLQYGRSHDAIAIRSSIPDMYAKAVEKSNEAAMVADSANKLVSKISTWGLAGAIIAGISFLGVAATVAGLSIIYWRDTNELIVINQSQVDQQEKQINELQGEIERLKVDCEKTKQVTC